MRRLILLLAACALIALVLFLALKKPSADGNWLEEQSRTATASFDEGSVTIKNVRDWTYGTEGPRTKDWKEVSVDTNEITDAWFYTEPFSDWKAVGHTFLAFRFADETVLSFSVEAKRETGEEYSALRGLLPTYELSYVWGTERDLLVRRLVYLNHPLRLYRLTLPPEKAALLFRALAEETNEIAAKPRFYNTLTANCTNVLARIVNTHYPDTLPYDLSWNFTGYADLYLMKQGLIEKTGSPEETRTARDLTPHRAAVADSASLPQNEFSSRIRELLGD